MGSPEPSIPCDVCGVLFPWSVYLDHQAEHEREAHPQGVEDDEQLARRLQEEFMAEEREEGGEEGEGEVDVEDDGTYHHGEDADAVLARQLQEEEMALSQALAMSIASADRLAGTRNQPSRRVFCDHTAVYLNTLRGQQRNHTTKRPTVSWADICAGPVKEVFTTIFDFDPAFFFPSLPTGIPIVIVQGADPPEKVGKVTPDWAQGIKGLTVVSAPLKDKNDGNSNSTGRNAAKRPKKKTENTDSEEESDVSASVKSNASSNGSRSWDGLQHAKLVLLVFPTFLRCVVSSSNHTDDAWTMVGEVVWVYDFPPIGTGGGGGRGSGRGEEKGKEGEEVEEGEEERKGRKRKAEEEEESESESEFGESLVDFVQALMRGATDVYAHWAEIIRRYDMRACDGKVHLIASVPGTHHGEESERLGQAKVKKILSKFTGNFVATDPIDYVASSVGHVGFWLLRPLVSALTGGATSSTPFRLVYPTWERVRRERPNGLGHLMFTPANWSNNISAKGAPPLLRGCGEGCTQLHRHFPCLMLKLEGGAAGRNRVVEHSKCAVREGKDGVGWVYFGSHNLSVSAWGSAKANGAVAYNNYELGVLITDVPISSYDLPYMRPAEPFGLGDIPFFLDPTRADSQREELQRLYSAP